MTRVIPKIPLIQTILPFQDKGIVGNKKATRDASDGSKDYSLLVYSSLLKNEILGTSIEDFKEAAAYANSPVIGSSNGNTGTDSNNIQGNAVVTTGGNNAERRGANGTTLPPGTFNSPGGVTNVPCGTSNRYETFRVRIHIKIFLAIAEKFPN